MIAIVGAGVTGLALAWELRGRDVDFVLLEAASRAGGVIRTIDHGGLPLDCGPQRTRSTSRVRALVDALGLGDRILTAPADLDLFVAVRGALRALPLSLTGLLRSDVLTAAGKLRLVLEPLTGPARAHETVGALLERKLGREAYRAFAGPLYAGLFASHPDDMPASTTLLPTLRAADVGRSLVRAALRANARGRPPPPAITFRDGMAELTDALAHAAGDRLRLSTPVRELRRSGSGWRVVTDDGGIDAEQVVVTTPAGAAARILKRLAPHASWKCDGLRYNGLVVVHLSAETELRGLGLQVALQDHDGPLRGVTFNDALFGRHHLYTAFLGGGRWPEICDLTDAALGTLARRGFRARTGYDAEVLHVTRTSMPAWDASWRRVDPLALPDGITAAGSWRSRPGIQGRLDEARTLADRLAVRAGRLKPPAAVPR